MYERKHSSLGAYSLCCLTSESLRNNFLQGNNAVCLHIHIHGNNYRKFYVYDCGLHFIPEIKNCLVFFYGLFVACFISNKNFCCSVLIL